MMLPARRFTIHDSRFTIVMSVLIAPSILAADFSHLADEVRRVEEGGADWIHCDIMDGHFVDNISFGPAIVKTVRQLTNLPLDVHLMIEHPDHYVPRFVEAGANSITVHVEPESKHEVAQTLQQIRDAGCRTGLTLNPATSFEFIKPFLPHLDLILIMTVHPGFGGQSFRAEQLEKIRRARDWKTANNSAIYIEADGGITPETAPLCIESGANVLVAGTAIFHSGDYRRSIAQLKSG